MEHREIQLAAGRGKIADLSFGLPPFGRVPGFGLGIADFKKSSKQRFSCGSGFQPRSCDLNGFNDLPFTVHRLRLNDFYDLPLTRESNDFLVRNLQTCGIEPNAALAGRCHVELCWCWTVCCRHLLVTQQWCNKRFYPTGYCRRFGALKSLVIFG